MAKNTTKNAAEYNKAARARYDSTHRATVGTSVSAEQAELFRQICTANGETPNAVLKRAIEDYISFNIGM